MRGLVALVMMLAVAAFSGCVELVADDPELDAAATEAAIAVHEHNSKFGHVSGMVIGSDGTALVGASVELTTVAEIYTDHAGRFSFLDLTPGGYSLLVEAKDHLAVRQDILVVAGQFYRPEVHLEAIPAPEPYTTVESLHGSTSFSAFGLSFSSCDCSLAGELDEEGLVEVLIEARIDEDFSTIGGSMFDWSFVATAGDESDSTGFGGYDGAPLRVSIPGDQIAEGAQAYELYIAPSPDLVSMGQEFSVFVTSFYHEGPAKDYTAFE